jgi:CxxC-x17-CxxC domain-containing protein
MIRRRRPERAARRSSHRPKPRGYKVVCSVCGLELTVPVPPPPGKILTCLKCLEAAKNEAAEGAGL